MEFCGYWVIKDKKIVVELKAMFHVCYDKTKIIKLQRYYGRIVKLSCSFLSYIIRDKMEKVNNKFPFIDGSIIIFPIK